MSSYVVCTRRVWIQLWITTKNSEGSQESHMAGLLIGVSKVLRALRESRCEVGEQGITQRKGNMATIIGLIYEHVKMPK